MKVPVLDQSIPLSLNKNDYIGNKLKNKIFKNIECEFTCANEKA